mmetsp:Transcript_19433/g.59863  ORF Transcript_19433/g.59863 Transcript_19433/m.59863 type:complete len:211 (+) Transcript_19433:496-1128(+)
MAGAPLLATAAFSASRVAAAGAGAAVARPRDERLVEDFAVTVRAADGTKVLRFASTAHFVGEGTLVCPRAALDVFPDWRAALPDACELRIELKRATDGKDARPLLPSAHDLFAVGLDACVGCGAGAAPAGAVALANARDVDVHVAAAALRVGSGDETAAAAALDACPGLLSVPAPDDREVRLFRSAPLPGEVDTVELLRPPDLPEGITEL